MELEYENERSKQALLIIREWLADMMASAYAPASSRGGYTIQTCIDLADEALSTNNRVSRPRPGTAASETEERLRSAACALLTQSTPFYSALEMDHGVDGEKLYRALAEAARCGHAMTPPIPSANICTRSDCEQDRAEAGECHCSVYGTLDRPKDG